MIAATRIDRATPEQLAIYESNLKRSIRMNVSFFHRIISETLLNRVHCRQQEWAERNWLNANVQMEYHQLLQENRIEPPIG